MADGNLKFKDINARERSRAKRARNLLRKDKLIVVNVDKATHARRVDNWFKNIFKQPVVVSPFGETLLPKKFDESYSVFSERLKKKGWAYLGSGNFSTVYGKEGINKVIKITHSANTDGWIHYAKWANENGYGGKWAPKLFSHKYFEKGQFSVSIVEKLHARGYEEQRPDRVIETLARFDMKNTLAKTLLDLAEPGMPEFLEKAKTRFGWNDDHGANVLMRADGTLVYNDPVAYNHANDNFKFRLRSKDLLPKAA